MPPRQPPPSSHRGLPEKLDLPRGFVSIRELLDASSGFGRTISVVGVVKDYRLPVPTKGTDHKCTLTLYDLSNEEDNDGINFNIFRQEGEMPIVEAGDIVIASMVKYQTYGGAPNLLSERRTDVHVYEAQRIPTCRSLGSAWGALKKPTRKVNREPTAKENEYVLWLYEKIDKSTIPDQQEFSARAEQSRNIRDKFKLLKDVRDQNFADVIVQIVREPFDLGDKICVWVSDYTENAGFFHKTRNDAASADGYSYRDGDPYGYTNKFNKKQASSTDDANSAWIGPYGKTSVQLTCWEPHATFLRHNVRAGDWVRVRNVQVGYGRNSVNIEGFVREDRSFPNRVCVELLDVHADRETIDQRLLDALRRKRDYERSEKASEQTSQKRKAEEAPKKENAKSKRQKKRESKQKAAEEEKAKEEATHNLNDLIKCENQDKQLVPLSTLLEPVRYHTTIDQAPATVELPFTCAKYRTRARVVDFHPASLKEFAVRRRVGEYDALSDEEDNDSSSDSSRSSSAAGPRLTRRHAWEWRFALKLEEPLPTGTTKKSAPAAVWVLVDNMAAQLLTGLDAADLRSRGGEARLAALRERMFALWGNLEERKSRLEDRKRQHLRNPLQAPPADSSDLEDNGAQGGEKKSEEGLADGQAGTGHVPGSSQLSNKPFECCIRQYGLRIEAEDGEDDAGSGRKWVKAFGLFGTKIASD